MPPTQFMCGDCHADLSNCEIRAEAMAGIRFYIRPVIAEDWGIVAPVLSPRRRGADSNVWF
jgi:hypothetical protein